MILYWLQRILKKAVLKAKEFVIFIGEIEVKTKKGAIVKLEYVFRIG